MPNRSCLAALFWLWVWMHPASFAAEPDPAVETLVRQLGSRSFRTREQATRRLIELGPQAVPALRAGCDSTDPDVSQRCQRILREPRASSLDDLLEAFVKDPSSTRGRPLAGWQRFQTLAGSDPAARRVFGEMYRSAGELFERLEADPQAARSAWAERCRAIQQRRFNPKPAGEFRSAEVMATIFLITDPRLRVSEPDFAIGLSTLSASPRADDWPWPLVGRFLNNLLDEMTDPARAVPLMAIARSLPESGVDDRSIRAILLRLLPRVETDLLQAAVDFQSVEFFLTFGRQAGLAEVVPLARQVLRDQRFSAVQHVIALQIICELDRRDARTTMDRALADQRSLGQFKPGGKGEWITHKVCDTALHGLLQRTGQSAADYGFPYARINPQPLDAIGTLGDGFASDRDRAAAIRKWRDWQAHNCKD